MLGNIRAALGTWVSLGGKITEQIAEQIIDKILYLRVLDVTRQFYSIYVPLKKKRVRSLDEIWNFVIFQPN